MIVVMIAIIFIYLLVIYNMLVKRKNEVVKSKSTIDVYLMQRFDLIPNLTECVKGYVKYEKDILDRITQMRAKYLENKKLKEGEILNNQVNTLIAVIENYPELKANEQFLNLQKSLQKMENQIQAARRIYNQDVLKYNKITQVFPSNIIAKLFGFQKEDFFEM